MAMAASDKEILNTTKKGMKKNAANHNIGTSITAIRPKGIFFSQARP